MPRNNSYFFKREGFLEQKNSSMNKCPLCGKNTHPDNSFCKRCSDCFKGQMN